MRTELKTASVRNPEEIRSRLSDEVERYTQTLPPQTDVPVTTSNLIRSSLDDFIDAHGIRGVAGRPIRIQGSKRSGLREYWYLMLTARAMEAPTVKSLSLMVSRVKGVVTRVLLPPAMAERTASLRQSPPRLRCARTWAKSSPGIVKITIPRD
jgi:hypothetical protein